jgi:hypothetical protein
MVELRAQLVLEILGRPAEHLTMSLTQLVDKIKQEKGITVVGHSIAEPKKVEGAENFWSSFANLELTCGTVPALLNILMTYLPAHVEVFEPENLRLTAAELNELGNYLLGRLHNYDALAKKMLGEQDILKRKLEFLRQGGDPAKVFAPTPSVNPLAQPKSIVKPAKSAKANANKKK